MESETQIMAVAHSKKRTSNTGRDARTYDRRYEPIPEITEASQVGESDWHRQRK